MDKDLKEAEKNIGKLFEKNSLVCFGGRENETQGDGE